MPPGVIQHPASGRYAFGSRIEDTLPYLVLPGADAAVRPEEVSKMPISVNAFSFTFDLSDKEQVEQYQVVMHAIAAGWYRREHIERHRVIKPMGEFDSLMDQMNNGKPRPIG